MTLDQLQIVKSVQELGSLKLASEALHKTQPALSKAIKNLEQQFGFAIFDRSQYRLTLTAEGKQIYQHALKVLDSASALKQLSRHLQQGLENSVTLAFDSNFDSRRLAPVIRQCQQRYGNTQLVLKQHNVTGAIEALSKQQAQLAICALPNLQIETLDLDVVAIDKLVLINVIAPDVAAQYAPLNQREQLKHELQIVLQDTGSASGSKDLGVSPDQRRLYVNNMQDKYQLIKAGVGWGRVPFYLVKQDLAKGRLQKLALNDAHNELVGDIYLIKSKHQVLGPVADFIWQTLSRGLVT
ncbi:LysR family transcriptional regulator [Motilimonas sp. KMU-193]|uniref:LysR family transcriptional regulator n=1 Tax=Motilimonas sp. KMU-193 TaxID=3388668 RepID=UPI00396B2C54